jgi:hypothetical protein
VLVAASKEGDGRVHHASQRARDDRERDEQHLAKVEELTAAGVRVIERPRHDDKTVRGLCELTTGEGKKLTADTHAQCAGHAAYLECHGHGALRRRRASAKVTTACDGRWKANREWPPPCSA